jgi:hypothetical protein
MVAMTSRSEGVALRPFAGLEVLETFINENVLLEVASNAGKFDVAHRGWLGLTPHDIERLGLTINVQNADSLRKLVDPIVMDLKDVTVFVVAIDRKASVLRENFVLGQFDLSSISNQIQISTAGGDEPHRILSNKRSGFRIEFALVQNKDIPGDNAIRPRKKGALIAKAAWEVKPVSDGDAFQPDELTDEIRENFGLSSDSWVYFDAKPEILTATSFVDAAAFYVDKDLLDQIQLLTGESQTLAEMLVYSSAITHLVYEFSFALRADDATVDPEELSESQMFRLFRKKFKNRTDAEILDLVKDEPGRVVTEFLANQSDYKNLLSALKELNGGTNELSDFED